MFNAIARHIFISLISGILIAPQCDSSDNEQGKYFCWIKGLCHIHLVNDLQRYIQYLGHTHKSYMALTVTTTFGFWKKNIAASSWDSNRIYFSPYPNLLLCYTPSIPEQLKRLCGWSLLKRIYLTYCKLANMGCQTLL